MNRMIDNNCNKKPDVFDRIMQLGFLKKFEPIYKKNKEVLLYLFFGVLTTLVSYITFFIPIALINLPDFKIFGMVIDTRIVISNIISWICAVTFSYITARIWVFTTNAFGKKAIFKEAVSFYGGRVFTLIVETAIISIGVQQLSLSETIMKILASIVVLILNYVISKLFVFKKTTDNI